MSLSRVSVHEISVLITDVGLVAIIGVDILVVNNIDTGSWAQPLLRRKMFKNSAVAFRGR